MFFPVVYCGMCDIYPFINFSCWLFIRIYIVTNSDTTGCFLRATEGLTAIQVVVGLTEKWFVNAKVEKSAGRSFWFIPTSRIQNILFAFTKRLLFHKKRIWNNLNVTLIKLIYKSEFNNGLCFLGDYAQMAIL